jgi:hypothetical protein
MSPRIARGDRSTPIRDAIASRPWPPGYAMSSGPRIRRSGLPLPYSADVPPGLGRRLVSLSPRIDAADLISHRTAGASILRIESSAPVSSHFSSETGIIPASSTARKNSFIAKSGPRCRAHVARRSSIIRAPVT